MRSPFPGMDPYLEDPALWSDFHSTFINYWREAIADLLPDHYEARIGDRVSLTEGFDGPGKRIIPDVSIHRGGAVPADRPAPAGGGVGVLEPVTIPLLILDPAHEAYIEILGRPGRSLVAVLELLSPSNRVGAGRESYLAKRNAVIAQDVHLLELDLLLGGQRIPLAGSVPAGDYYAFLSRSDRFPNCEVYAWSIRRPLPTLPIPLVAPDPDLRVDLGAVFATAYERGRYARSLTYGAPPPVPVPGEDQDWVIERGRAAIRG